MYKLVLLVVGKDILFRLLVVIRGINDYFSGFYSNWKSKWGCFWKLLMESNYNGSLYYINSIYFFDFIVLKWNKFWVKSEIFMVEKCWNSIKEELERVFWWY